MRQSLSPSSSVADLNLSLKMSELYLSEVLASFIYTSLARVKCLFTGRDDFSNLVGKPTFIIFLGLFNICWG
jgi:hypothetical protein